MKTRKTARIRKTRSDYPVPGEVGGRLIRELVRFLRSEGWDLPISSHILCACSGGGDSVALSVLLARYGRRIGERITLVHVNHGWRGEESDSDEDFVRDLADRLGAGFVSRRIRERPRRGESWEAHARDRRKAVFREVSLEFGGAPVLTGHSADDQAETRLWRLFTGAFETLGRGILPSHGVEVRPLLGIRREALREFLREEREIWREDSSNQNARFLRTRLRRDLMPVIESLFPGAVEAINSVDRPERRGSRESHDSTS